MLATTISNITYMLAALLPQQFTLLKSGWPTGADLEMHVKPLLDEGVKGIPGITGLSFFETFTIMYAPPLIMVAAIVFLFVYMALYKNPKD
ncbi:cytochrome bd oxidase small subunit CydS [Paenibacillus sp. TSA_86.1]|uniref:cytochrome bd oxidase small subunit CydS n=1 Tax=Paenibacillus sp. TSA_86.1 TaxID=3415649 RepID=UPI0040460BB5